jgi:preprotein translocase subunit SecG
MRRDRLSILVVLTALLAVGMVGAALVAPSGTADAGQSGDRTITLDATGSPDADLDRSVALVAALGAVPLALAGRRRLG